MCTVQLINASHTSRILPDESCQKNDEKFNKEFLLKVAKIGSFILLAGSIITGGLLVAGAITFAAIPILGFPLIAASLCLITAIIIVAIAARCFGSKNNSSAVIRTPSPIVSPDPGIIPLSTKSKLESDTQGATPISNDDDEDDSSVEKFHEVNKALKEPPKIAQIAKKSSEIPTQASISVPVPVAAPVPTSAPQSAPPKDIRSCMLDTFHNVWKTASMTERQNIKQIWSLIMKGAQIHHWQEKELKQHAASALNRQFTLKLEKEVSGTHPEVPGKATISQLTYVKFSEEGRTKIITFPKGGITQQIGEGFFSTNILLARILVEGNSISIEFGKWGMSKILKMNVEDAVEFWEGITWAK